MLTKPGKAYIPPLKMDVFLSYPLLENQQPLRIPRILADTPKTQTKSQFLAIFPPKTFFVPLPGFRLYPLVVREFSTFLSTDLWITVDNVDIRVDNPKKFSYCLIF
ncbi:MAG: hypothetical protein J6K32_04975 [Clostridia bacterium]|nr:hypothetical protein [Clostridia bacterium]